MSIRVAVFEDNKKYRDSLGVLIDGTPGLCLAGAFADANNIEADIRDNRVDLVLMDIGLPGTDGIDALKTIKHFFPGLAVLMQTVFEDETRIFEAVCSGASGYILKNTPPARILEAIVETYEGGAPMSPLIAKKVLHLLRRQHPEPAGLSPDFMLTPREKEVLRLMVQGMSYKMIAANCGIAFETVRSHIRNIYEKLHVATMTEAVAKAIRTGLTQ